MVNFPNLAHVATQDLVEQIGGGAYKASYINWSRTMQMLRDNAPGWLPVAIPTEQGGLVHPAGVGGYLLLCFRNMETGQETPPVPQAVMGQKNEAVPFDEIDARDVTDTHRRGVCLAAAMTFGLAYELWAKMPLESGYQDGAKPRTVKAKAPPQTEPADDAKKARVRAMFAAATSPGELKAAATEARTLLSTADQQALSEEYTAAKARIGA